MLPKAFYVFNTETYEEELDNYQVIRRGYGVSEIHNMAQFWPIDFTEKTDFFSSEFNDKLMEGISLAYVYYSTPPNSLGSTGYAICANILSSDEDNNFKRSQIARFYQSRNYYPPYFLVEHIKEVPEDIQKSVINSVREYRKMVLKRSDKVLKRCNPEIIDMVMSEVLENNNLVAQAALKDLLIDTE